jgi:hypothetical protein
MLSCPVSICNMHKIIYIQNLLQFLLDDEEKFFLFQIWNDQNLYLYWFKMQKLCWKLPKEQEHIQFKYLSDSWDLFLIFQSIRKHYAKWLQYWMFDWYTILYHNHPSLFEFLQIFNFQFKSPIGFCPTWFIRTSNRKYNAIIVAISDARSK